MTSFFLSLPFFLASTMPQITAPDPAENAAPEALPGAPVAAPTSAPATPEPAAPPPAESAEAAPETSTIPETSAPEPTSDIAAFPAADTSWTLSEIDGAPVTATATLAFPEPGQIAGKAPCNTFRGSLDGTPQAFTIGPLATTQMACPDLDAETAFTNSLGSMTQADITPDRVTLSNADGGQMVFLPSK